MSSVDESEQVEELEKRVSEMEATIRGLTEELVDANTRIRKLEEREGMHEPMDRVEHETVQANGGGENADAQAEAESADEGAEASKDDDANEEAESEETGLGDDIIVA